MSKKSSAENEKSMIFRHAEDHHRTLSAPLRLTAAVAPRLLAR
jgi:hypothetical protein